MDNGEDRVGGNVTETLGVKNMTKQPQVKKLSIGIVAYNEEKYLPDLLEDVKQQKYPHELTEILLIDSCSTDHTRKIMEEFQTQNKDFYSVQVLDNPKKIQAAGWNVAIQKFTGDALARIDAHTKLTPEYSQFVMEDLQAGEKVAGGIRPCLIENDTDWAEVLLQVENSLFGSSANSSRRSQEKTYVKSMFHAAYCRDVLDKVGFFNENLLRTEDNEFHYRIREAGYQLCYDPRIVSFQYARCSLKQMVKQKYANGNWIGLTFPVCPGCISIYHLVPATFVLAIFVTTFLAKKGVWQFSALMWSLYAMFAFVGTAKAVTQKGFKWQHLLMPILFLLLHVAYGLGTLVGLLNIPKIRELKRRTV